MVQILFTHYGINPIPFPPRSKSGAPNIADGDMVLDLEQAVAHFGIAAPTLRQLYADVMTAILSDDDAKALGIARAAPGSQPLPRLTVSADDARVLKNSMYPGIRSHDWELFIRMCNRTALDPFTKQIYCTYRPDRSTGQLVFSVEIGIAGLRLLGVRTGELVGTKGPLFSGDGKEWVRAWCGDGQPTFAKFGVQRRGRDKYQVEVADWDAYVKMIDGDQARGTAIDHVWMKFGYLCLARCAEALAYRRVFPEIGVLYTPDEMAQTFNPPAMRNQPMDEGPRQHEDAQVPPDSWDETQLTEPPPRPVLKLA